MIKIAKKALLGIAMGVLAAGCAKVCQFGQTEGASGLSCLKFLSDIKVGMTQQEVQERIGVPESRRFDVTFRDKTYEEVWVYQTSVPTVLYFKNGVLEHKEYEQ